MLTHNKNGQAWGLDLMVALIIFSLGLITFFLYSINYSAEAEDNMDKMTAEGNFIADNLLTGGSPLNWSAGNVVSIGIVDSGKINSSKLETFYDMTLSDYEKTKRLFNTRYDYVLFLDEDFIIQSMSIQGIGKPGTDLNNINADNLIKITRFVIYNDKPVTAYLYIWGE